MKSLLCKYYQPLRLEKPSNFRLDRGNDIRFAARSTKTEAAAQAIFLHAIGVGIIPGALWWQILACWRRHPLQRSPPPAADASSSSERNSRELQRRTHGEGSLDRQAKSAAGSRPCGDRGHLGTSGMFAKER